MSAGEAALHGKRAQRVAPFPTLPRKDNNGENKATVYAKLCLNREFCAGALLRETAFVRFVCKQAFTRSLTRSFGFFRVTKEHKRNSLN